MTVPRTHASWRWMALPMLAAVTYALAFMPPGRSGPPPEAARAARASAVSAPSAEGDGRLSSRRDVAERIGAAELTRPRQLPAAEELGSPPGSAAVPSNAGRPTTGASSTDPEVFETEQANYEFGPDVPPVHYGTRAMAERAADEWRARAAGQLPEAVVAPASELDLGAGAARQGLAARSISTSPTALGAVDEGAATAARANEPVQATDEVEPDRRHVAEQVFAAQSVDQRWAVAEQQRIERALAQHGIGPPIYQGVECRETQCRLRLAPPTPDPFPQITKAMDSLGVSYQHFLTPSAGPPGVELYVSRDEPAQSAKVGRDEQ